jgi:hypothetical protein
MPAYISELTQINEYRILKDLEKRLVTQIRSFLLITSTFLKKFPLPKSLPNKKSTPKVTPERLFAPTPDPTRKATPANHY